MSTPAGGARRLVVVRPEPGNARTVAAARALGFAATAMPLFAVAPLSWTPPDPAAFDALVLTSANAVRHGGDGIDALRHLPVLAVGAATAAAARAAGFVVMATGSADAAALVEGAAAYPRLLHLGGRDRAVVPVAAEIAVYASDPLPVPGDAAALLHGATVLLHSTRAARAVAALAVKREATAIAAISPAVLDAAGGGWRRGVAAARPSDAALLAAATSLAAPASLAD